MQTPQQSGYYSIHTTDRASFKRCKRRWDFASPLRQYLAPIEGKSIALWFGTGFHFALEDFHGLRLWNTPDKAFEAYVQACSAEECPQDVAEHVDLAMRMFAHYMRWIQLRDEFEAAVFVDEQDPTKQKLACEVDFQIDLPELNMFDMPVKYEGTFDSLYLHKFTKKIWVAEYKTAKSFDVLKLATDDQVSSYVWALRKCLPAYAAQDRLGGVVYKQFKKNAPHAPIRLAGGGLSVNKQQSTTYGQYLQALKQLFPGVPIEKYEAKYREMLNCLSQQETLAGDDFINQQLVSRSEHNVATQYRKILADAYEMLNDPAITTNPTRDCTWDCAFRDVCIAMDEGADWENQIKLGFGKRTEVAEQWQLRLTIPPQAAKIGLEQAVGKTWKEFKDERKLVLHG